MGTLKELIVKRLEALSALDKSVPCAYYLHHRDNNSVMTREDFVKCCRRISVEISKFSHSHGNTIVGYAFSSANPSYLFVYPTLIGLLSASNCAPMAFDAANQVWRWIEDAVRDLSIRCIICDTQFAELLERSGLGFSKSASLAEDMHVLARRADEDPKAKDVRDSASVARPSETKISSTLASEALYAAEKSEAAFISNASRSKDLPNPKLESAVTALENVQDLAYVVQTSGTTGRRKTVLVTDSSVRANVEDFLRLFGADLDHTTKVFSASPPTFDPFYLDVLLAFLTESPLVMCSDGMKNNSKMLAENMRKLRVGFTQITPTLFKNLEPHLFVSTDCGLRHVVVGGEAFPGLSLEARTSGCRFYNVYGVTEMSVWQSMCLVTEDQCRRGQYPISNGANLLTGCEVTVDVDAGSSDSLGEIVVKSASRACHVLSDGDRAFVDADGRYCVRTNDVGRMADDGSVLFVGRAGDHLKVNGKRTSVAEIETEVGVVLGRACVGVVKDSAVTLDAGDKKSPSNPEVLCFVLDPGKLLSESEMLTTCRRSLPSHLMPSRMQAVTCFPLTSHGKVDRRALLTSMTERKRKRTSSSDLEILWRELTGRDPRSDERFVEAGGDSIAAVRMANSIEEWSGRKMPQLFEVIIDKSYADLKRFVEQNSFEGHREKRIPESAQQPNGNLLDNTDVEDDFGRNNSHSLSESWKVDLLKCVDASPLLLMTPRGAVVVVGSHSGHIAAVRVDDGVEMWRTKLPGRIEAAATASSIQAERIFVGCYDHHLYCLCVATGAILWKYCAEGEIKSAPLAFSLGSDDLVCVGAYDRRLHCVRAHTGASVWRTAAFEASIRAGCAATPHGDLVFCAGLDGTVAAVGVERGAVAASVKLDAPVFAALSFLAEKNVLMAASVAGEVRSFRVDMVTCSLVPKWVFKTGGPVYSGLNVVLPDNLVLFGCHDGSAYCVRVEDGVNQVWQTRHSSPVFSTPHLFSLDGVMTAVSISTDGLVKATALPTGVTLFSFKLEANKGVFSSPVVYGRKLIVGSRDNFMYCFDINVIK